MGCGAQPVTVAMQGLYQTAYQPERFVFVSHYVTRFGCLGLMFPPHPPSPFPSYSSYSFAPAQPLLMALPPGQQRGRG